MSFKRISNSHKTHVVSNFMQCDIKNEFGRANVLSSTWNVTKWKASASARMWSYTWHLRQMNSGITDYQALGWIAFLCLLCMCIVMGWKCLDALQKQLSFLLRHYNRTFISKIQCRLLCSGKTWQFHEQILCD